MGSFRQAHHASEAIKPLWRRKNAAFGPFHMELIGFDPHLDFRHLLRDGAQRGHGRSREIVRRKRGKN
jgi:hypothetical protein